MDRSDIDVLLAAAEKPCADAAGVPALDDTDPQVARQFRREPLLMLISRMQRGVLLAAERPLLRAAVETELADGDEAHRRAEATTHAMESTATDALKHLGCHRELMAQCQRAERAETALAAITALAFDATLRPDVRLSRIRNLIDPADGGTS